MADSKALIGYTKRLLVEPPQLTPQDLNHAIDLVIALLSQDNDDKLQNYVVVSSFLTSLRTTGLDHKAEYIAEAAKAVLAHSDTVDLSEHVKPGEVVLDIVGTGGDGQNTFNVSNLI